MIILASHTENGVHTVEIRIEPQEFWKALEDAYVENTDRIVVPGYAAGLAPRAEIEKLYGETALFDEALDLCVPKLYGQYLAERGIRPVGRPQLTSVTWMEGGGARFTVRCDVYPEVKLGTYRGVEVKAGRGNGEAFTAEALIAACRNMEAEMPQAMVSQKLEAMLAREKMKIGQDAIYHLLADFTAVLEEAYKETDVYRPKAQVQAEALDVMLQTVSGDNKELSQDKFHELIRELVEHYRIVPRSFDETIDRLIAERGEKKRAMTDEEKIEEAFEAYLGSVQQTVGLWKENNTERARDAARFDLLLNAVAEKEGLSVTEEELLQVYERIAEETGLDLEEVMAQVEEAPIREQLLRDKARALIVENAKEQTT